MTSSSPENENDIFTEQTTGAGPMSYETQEGIMDDLWKKFSRQWDAAGILRGIYDGVELKDGERKIFLRRVNQKLGGDDVHELYFVVEHDTSVRKGDETYIRVDSQRLPVAQQMGGFVFPCGRFVQEQADLVAKQVAELDGLREILTCVRDDLTISDPRKAISMVPRSVNSEGDRS